MDRASRDDLEVGFDVPAAIGMSESEIQTPCLILDLDALERNLRKMGEHARAYFAADAAQRAGDADTATENLRAVLDGILYGFDDRELVALDAASAEVLWRHPLGGGSLILVDRHLIAIAATGGLLHAVRAGPLGFEAVARARPFGPGSATSTPPSFAAGRIYVRDQKELVALEVMVSERPD